MSGLSTGRTLSERFTLIRPLRRRGGTEIWLVLDEHLGERLVAKILPADSGEDRVALLRRECRSARKLVHPNIVRVFDVRQSDGFNFITMAWVDGQDLRHLRGGSPAEIARILLKVVDALVYAHSQGVVHRDLKSTNVLCDRAGQPFLLDFGIAGALADGEELTLAGGGSRHCASPQQLAGADPATADDVYAFGVLLYELLDGRPPFWPDITEQAVRNEIPDAPRSKHRLPPALISLVASTLAKSPADRPRDMATVRRQLSEIVEQLPDGEPVGRVGSATDYRLTPPPRVPPIRPVAESRETPGADRRRPGRRILRWSFVTAAVVLLAIAGYNYVWPQMIARIRAATGELTGAAIPTPAPAPAPEAAPPPAGAPTGGGSLHFRRQAESSLGRAVELLDALEIKGAQKWGSGEYSAAESQLVRGDEYLTQGSYLEARDAYEEAVSILEDLDARELEVLQQALDDGHQALADGRSAAAIAGFELALVIAPGDPTATTGLTRAAVLDRVVELVARGAEKEAEGNHGAAVDLFTQAVDLDPMSNRARERLATARGRLHEDAFAVAMSSGLGALGRGDYQAALDAFRSADKLRPGAAEVADGLAQAEQSLRLEAIASHRGRAGELETAEQWSEAAEQFAAVIELDPTIRFAQAGRDRCLERASLEDRITFHLEHPGRLSSDTVYAEATELLDEASEISPAGPRHREQLERLDALLEVAGQRITVQLESDNLTEVVVYKVGRLGTFTRRELALRPGRYTVVGSRRGYRDVRRELVVEAGREHEPLVVRCEEKV